MYKDSNPKKRESVLEELALFNWGSNLRVVIHTHRRTYPCNVEISMLFWRTRNLPFIFVCLSLVTVMNFENFPNCIHTPVKMIGYYLFSFYVGNAHSHTWTYPLHASPPPPAPPPPTHTHTLHTERERERERERESHTREYREREREREMPVSSYEDL